MENELDILFPEQVVRIGDQEVTVREFTYLEALNLGTRALPLLLSMEAAGRETPDLLVLDRVLPPHADIWYELMAVATGRDVGWLKALGNRDGERLMLAFWAVNQDFFVRRIALLRVTANPMRTDDPSA